MVAGGWSEDSFFLNHIIKGSLKYISIETQVLITYILNLGKNTSFVSLSVQLVNIRCDESGADLCPSEMVTRMFNLVSLLQYSHCSFGAKATVLSSWRLQDKIFLRQSSLTPHCYTYTDFQILGTNSNLGNLITLGSSWNNLQSVTIDYSYHIFYDGKDWNILMVGFSM